MTLNTADQNIHSSADALADCALAVLAQRFPHKLDHLILDAGDHALPQQMHPVFDGCFDWHSSVHMHWSLLRLRALVPGLAAADAIARRFDAHVRPELVAREIAYLRTPGRASFERPYGWAWLLKLQAELHAQAGRDDATARWAAALRPLADEIARRFAIFLRQSHYPVRAGTHANSAFALLLARDHASTVGDTGLRDAIDRAATTWFGSDEAYPALYEPSGTDFLSPGLCEALLMQRVLGAGFDAWWTRFAPAGDALARWDTPAIVGDRRRWPAGAPRRPEPVARVVPARACGRGRRARELARAFRTHRAGALAGRLAPRHRRRLRGDALAGQLRAPALMPASTCVN